MAIMNKYNSTFLAVMTICFSLLLTINMATAENQATNGVKPTPNVMDLYGYINGAKAGDVLTVYDKAGVLCGQFILDKEGQYGFFHVYGDDKTTETDEGPEKNEALTFEFNGEPIEPLSGKQVIWKKDERLQVDF